MAFFIDFLLFTFFLCCDKLLYLFLSSTKAYRKLDICIIGNAGSDHLSISVFILKWLSYRNILNQGIAVGDWNTKFGTGKPAILVRSRRSAFNQPGYRPE